MSPRGFCHGYGAVSSVSRGSLIGMGSEVFLFVSSVLHSNKWTRMLF